MTDQAEQLINGVKDIFRYKITQWISTGDKMFDNTLIMFATGIITMYFTKEYFTAVKMNFSFYKDKILSAACCKKTRVVQLGITRENYDYYAALVEKKDKYYGAISVAGEDFDKKLTDYLCSTVPWIFTIQYPGKYNLEKNLIEQNDNLRSGIMDSVKGVIPVYISQNATRNKIIAVYSASYRTGIKYETGDSLREFIEFIKNRETPMPEEKKSGVLLIQEHHNSGQLVRARAIYANRTMSGIISKHKTRICHALDAFIQTNKTGNSAFNGFGTYNLGLMFYGVPGTGKTFFIKAICNYLQRHACIVNMRKIKTVNDLLKIFEHEHVTSSRVFVFDEFDCVQGVLSRDLETKDQPDGAGELRERYMQLLRIQSKATGDAESKETFKKQIAQLEQELEDLKNKLTLETFLTTLDGTCEMRGRVIIATTNYISRIDPALLRGGRFDVKVELREFDHDECRELIIMMYKDYNFETKREGELMRRIVSNTIRFHEYKFTPVFIMNLATEKKKLSEVCKVLCVPHV